MKKIIFQNRSYFLVLFYVIMLLTIRMLIHRSFHFGFLFWNLFLAFLPLIISSKIAEVRKRIYSMLLFSIWLLLFPNAAYLVTDLTHLAHSSSKGYWLDLMILFCAALLGIAIATKSLQQMELWYRSMLPKRASHLLTLILLMLNGYGIYLGRVERWNSWDVLTETGALGYSISYQIRHPFRCQEVWLLSLVFGVALAIVFYSKKLIPAASYNSPKQDQKKAE